MDQIEIRTHEDISNVSEKYYMFTFRQWVGIIFTALIAIPLYVKVKPVLGDNIASWIVIFIAIPPMAFGFIQIQGMSFEKMISYIFRQYTLLSKSLEYKTDEELLSEKNKKKTNAKAKKSKKATLPSSKTIQKVEEKPTVKEIKPSRAEKKLEKKENKRLAKIEHKKAMEKKKLEKQRVKELRLERKQAKELAKARKKYGDWENISSSLKEREMQFNENNITLEDLQNIVLLGKKAEQLKGSLEKKEDANHHGTKE